MSGSARVSFRCAGVSALATSSYCETRVRGVLEQRRTLKTHDPPSIYPAEGQVSKTEEREREREVSVVSWMKIMAASLCSN